MQWVYRLHKWASLLVGLQLMIWLLTGLYFNVVDHETASGNIYRSNATKIMPEHPASGIAIAQLLTRYPDTTSVEQTVIDQKPFYLLYAGVLPHRYQLQQVIRVDPITGNDTGELTQDQAIRSARATYSGPGNVVSARRLIPPHRDMVGEENPVWQVQFDDAYQTRAYLHAITGDLIGHVNDPSALHAWMFRLHFMDYFDTGGFNTPLLKIFSVMALLLSFSGTAWLIKLISQGQFRFSVLDKRHTLRVVDQNNTAMSLRTTPQQTILNAALQHGLPVASQCGGGGQCGRCQILMRPLPRATAQERHILTTEALEQGHRLACQHRCAEAEEVRLNHVDNEIYWLTLTDKRYLSASVISLWFQPDKAVSYRAGAHMQFQIPEGDVLFIPPDLPEQYRNAWCEYQGTGLRQSACQRNYSVANAKIPDGSLSFLIRLHPPGYDVDGNLQRLPGKGSMFLSSLIPGDTICATGPFESFRLQSHGLRRRVFIGAGSGMAPLRAMVEQLLFVDVVATPLTLIQGAKTREALFYRSEFNRWKAWFNNFSYQTVCSQEPSDAGHTGYVQSLVQQLIVDLNTRSQFSVESEFYLCGPKEMMAEVSNILLLCNIPQDRIFTDEFSYD